MFTRRKTKTDGESGGATVEFVLWMPIFILIIGLVIDASMAMLAHARIWDVARDTTRQLSIGEMTAAEAKTYAETEAKLSGVTPTVLANDSGDDVWVDISLPISAVTPFNVMGLGGRGNIEARVTMVREPT